MMTRSRIAAPSSGRELERRDNQAPRPRIDNRLPAKRWAAQVASPTPAPIGKYASAIRTTATKKMVAAATPSTAMTTPKTTLMITIAITTATITTGLRMIMITLMMMKMVVVIIIPVTATIRPRT